MKGVLIGVLAIGAVLAAARFATVRRQLQTERQEVDAAWQEVDSALEERASLIPSLAEALERASPQHGAAVSGSVSKAREALANGRTPEEKIAANSRLSNALARLLELSERYPKLRSDKNFTRLEEAIGGTENRIAVERRKYNESLEHYNSSIQMFPGNIVGAFAGFRRNDAYFQTDPGAAAKE
ncbi:MAG: LemA family protein [Acidobacteriia bacterium]|nr:LemA family protein [Terriglobia bacterium]